jgi:NAD(P)-dependent dehydrogenase (short-subunit alcohol dehydrogenase family)
MKTVMITGASSGIGAAATAMFREHGWQVAATMRTPPDPPERPDGRVLTTRLDVADHVSIASAINATVERFGGLDVVVNNAGYGQYGIFEAVSPQDVQRQLDVNLLGTMAVIRAALPSLRAAGDGVIVNVSSGAGLYGLPLSSIYCASKYAVEGFTEAVSYELHGIGIAVKLVIPHGGVSGTAFGSATSLPAIPEEYQAYADRTWSAAASRPAPEPIAAANVAATILEAATDRTQRLRYLVGNDTRGLIAALDLPMAEREPLLRELLG